MCIISFDFLYLSEVTGYAEVTCWKFNNNFPIVEND